MTTVNAILNDLLVVRGPRAGYFDDKSDADVIAAARLVFERTGAHLWQDAECLEYQARPLIKELADRLERSSLDREPVAGAESTPPPAPSREGADTTREERDDG